MTDSDLFAYYSFDFELVVAFSTGLFCVHEEGQCVNIATTEEADDCIFLQRRKRGIELVAPKGLEALLIKSTALSNDMF